MERRANAWDMPPTLAAGFGGSQICDDASNDSKLSASGDSRKPRDGSVVSTEATVTPSWSAVCVLPSRLPESALLVSVPRATTCSRNAVVEPASMAASSPGGSANGSDGSSGCGDTRRRANGSANAHTAAACSSAAECSSAAVGLSRREPSAPGEGAQASAPSSPAAVALAAAARSVEASAP